MVYEATNRLLGLRATVLKVTVPQGAKRIPTDLWEVRCEDTDAGEVVGAKRFPLTEEGMGEAITVADAFCDTAGGG